MYIEPQGIKLMSDGMLAAIGEVVGKRGRSRFLEEAAAEKLERQESLAPRLSLYLLDTTVLIAHMRGDEAVTNLLLDLLADRHVLGTSCVNVAEVERGIRPKERKAADALLTGLRFFETTRDAASRAGRYQADFERRGGDDSCRRRPRRRHCQSPRSDLADRQRP